MDSFGRTVDYLRLSITDRCNERCAYCMPADYSDWLPTDQMLDEEEILRLAAAAVDAGFTKFRVTGGEPLVRNGVVSIVRHLAGLPGVESVSMTTNGTRLAALAGELSAAGLKQVNISLDALDEEVYHRVTRGRVAEALAGIDAAVSAGFERVKLNTVLMRGVNESQLAPIVRYAAERGVVVRFIELMPVSMTDVIAPDRFLSIAAAKRILREAGCELCPIDARLGHGPARYCRATGSGLGGGVDIGFIAAMTDDHFCETCNKMRVTADGTLRPCLGNHGEVDLKPALRHKDRETGSRMLRHLFAEALRDKPRDHLFRAGYQPLRIMTAIGG